MLNQLDSLLHSQTRLAIMSLLMNLEEAEFIYLKEQTGVSAGNLSLQLEKLRAGEYIEIRKGFKKKYPVTICNVTAKGREAFRQYVLDIKQYLEPGRQDEVHEEGLAG
nr:transcriptional regulator [uncultured Fluviicola sp.]